MEKGAGGRLLDGRKGQFFSQNTQYIYICIKINNNANHQYASKKQTVSCYSKLFVMPHIQFTLPLLLCFVLVTTGRSVDNCVRSTMVVISGLLMEVIKYACI